ncbi:unnamed protein product [Bursaphelenchus xylophilus]|uniref:(pine wood nematode) hypothetical protein n=1 Tax=Bursaphelenchus xylophilus TaxID=6326 RepID=A0A1I7S0W9_BURXY|nr:unnamed protein product [Bursaphelenchus xylophilus]CAG9088154.1 unnamed protein product [Bursaphelenchus xylophilus]
MQHVRRRLVAGPPKSARIVAGGGQPCIPFVPHCVHCVSPTRHGTTSAAVLVLFLCFSPFPPITVLQKVLRGGRKERRKGKRHAADKAAESGERRESAPRNKPSARNGGTFIMWRSLLAPHWLKCLPEEFPPADSKTSRMGAAPSCARARERNGSERQEKAIQGFERHKAAVETTPDYCSFNIRTEIPD